MADPTSPETPAPRRPHASDELAASFKARPDEAALAELEAERAYRLDPSHRPAHAQVDNTHRHFNPETGHFDDETPPS